METNTEDDEIRAMAEVSAVLSRLNPEAAGRVVRWAASRYRAGGAASEGQALGLGIGREGQGAYGDFPSLFAAANPQTEADKALVAGYWFQVAQGQTDLDALRINAELKNLGHGLSNVTRAFDGLMSGRPQLAIQTRKTGKSKQARKKYRLTAEGIRVVEALLARPRTESNG